MAEPRPLQAYVWPATGGGFWGCVRAGCAAELATTPEPMRSERDVWRWAASVELRPACGHSNPGPHCWRATAATPGGTTP